MKYSRYKDTGIEWLGDVPEHWSVKKLRFLVKITTGNKDTENREEDGQYPFYVRSQKVESISSFSYDGEAILTAGDGVGVCKVWHYANCKFDFHQRVYMLYDFKEIGGKFLFHYIKNNFVHEILKLSAKSTVDSLRLPMFKEFVVAYPSLKEQLSISNFLDNETFRIDTLIEKKQLFIQTLNEKRISIISHFVTKGLNKNTTYKVSIIDWLDTIPNKWEEKALKYVCTINDQTLPETTEPEYEIKYVDIGSIDKVKGIVKKEQYLFDEAPSRARRIVKQGDILVSTVRTYLRAIAPVINPEDNLIVSTGFAVIRPKKIDSEYLSFLLRSKYFVEKVVSMSVGVSYPAINASALGSIKIPIPSPQEQVQITEYLNKEIDAVDNLVRLTENHIEKLKEYKTALISSVVTGKIKVTD